MSWRSVLTVVRGLVAFVGTLALSVAFTWSVGIPEWTILVWMFMCGFVWLTWVIPPPPKSIRSRWWFAKISVQLLGWIVATWAALALVILLIQVLVSPS